MTTPPPDPDPQGAPPPAPPQPPSPPADGDTAEELRGALKRERDKTKDLEARLARLEAERMTDSEKAVAKARAEGKAEAEAAAARQLAAAEFRYAAAGRIADPAAALDLIDLSRLLDKDGNPDPKLIAAAVERLAGPEPGPDSSPGPGGGLPAGRVPPGPRPPAPAADGDFIRMVRRGTR